MHVKTMLESERHSPSGGSLCALVAEAEAEAGLKPERQLLTAPGECVLTDWKSGRMGMSAWLLFYL